MSEPSTETVANEKPYQYIVIEGPDCTGKSTLVAALAKRIENSMVAAFPGKQGESRAGAFLREVFASNPEYDACAIMYLFLADLAERQSGFYQQLEAGYSLICDRHPFVSGWVYQSEELETEHIVSAQSRTYFLQPEITFILDAPLEVLETRLLSRGEKRDDRFETQDMTYRAKIRAKYMAYAAMHSGSVVVLDATASTEALCDEVIHWMTPKPGYGSYRAVESKR